jgi:UDP-perosamine 4-acetyltransferase
MASVSEAGRLVIVGAGGHAKVVIELFRAARPELQIAGLIDTDPTPREVLGVAVIGDDAALAQLRGQGVTHAFVGFGANRERQAAGARLEALGYEIPSVVSPAATVSPSARLGRGLAVMAGVVINADAEIGDYAIVNTGARVDHDCRIGRAAHVGPGASLCGTVTVGERTLIGVGASVIPGASIGSDVVVGGGACVAGDLPDGVVAVGVPARALERR